MTTPVRRSQLLAQARATMPGVNDTERSLAALADRRTALRAAFQPEPDVLAAATRAVLDGDPLPDQLGEQIVATRRVNEAAQAENTALDRIEHNLHQQRRAQYAAGVDDGLAVVAAALDQVLTAARPELAELGAVRDPQTAIERDLTDAWTGANDMARQYAAVRNVQAVLVHDHIRDDAMARMESSRNDHPSTAATNLVNRFGTVRNPDELVDPTDLVDKPRRDPDVKQPVLPWATGDLLDNLAFAADENTQTWVPNLAELLAARDRVEHAAQEAAREAATAGTRGTAGAVRVLS